MATEALTGSFSHNRPLLIVGANVHHDIEQFLFREALLLDHERYEDWTELLARDIRYRAPVLYAHAIGVRSPVDAQSLEKDYASLMAEARRLQERKRGATHVRRLITNVIVCPRNCEEYDVLSYLLITRVDPSGGVSLLVSAERRDQLRRAVQSFKLVRREIVMDQPATAVDIPLTVFGLG
jgi:3-phenylpropionate/cinnamic acid dioxygenase small subunit